MSGRAVVTTANVIFSIKTFLAAMLAYFIAIRFDLPRPFWAVATFYIVAHPLSGATLSKSVYRLLGTIIGGVATLVMVPSLVNAPMLLSVAIIVWVFACTFISLLDRTPRTYVPLLTGYTVLLAGLPLVTAPGNHLNSLVSIRRAQQKQRPANPAEIPARAAGKRMNSTQAFELQQGFLKAISFKPCGHGWFVQHGVVCSSASARGMFPMGSRRTR